jgi:predicted Zn finger-like uncharacterized protein
MKIVCENCGAKYSIADEKVKGKVFKIRCKKCSESILVRGDANQAAGGAETEQPTQEAAAYSHGSDEGLDAETRVFDYAGYHHGADGEAAWHVVVDDQQQGPYTAEQINEYLQAGGINLESLIWREGFDDWVLIKDVPEFAKVSAAGGGLFGGQPDASKLFDDQPSGGLFGAGGGGSSPFDSGGGLFSSADSALGGDVFSSAAQESTTGGLFGEVDKGSALFGNKEESADEGIFSSTKDSASAAASGPRVSAAQAMMTGQRNENSVLFSLSNLQALAAGPAKEKAVAVSNVEGAPPPGFASTAGGEEASGLIDIRALAGSLSTAEQDNSVDDLISMGGGGFSPALGAPVLAAQNESVSNTVKFAVIGGAVAVLALIVVVLVVVLSGDNDAQTAAQAQIAALQKQIEALSKKGNAAGNAEAIAQLQSQLAAKQQAAAKSAGEPSASNTKKSAGSSGRASEDGSSAKKSSGSSKKRSGGKGASSSPSSSSASSASSSSSSSKSSKSSGSSSASASEKPSSAAKSSKTSELDDLLGSASKSSKSSRSSKSSKSSKSSSSQKSSGGRSSGAAPKASLSRSDVQRGMAAVAPAVKRCGQGKGGTITMNIMIGKTGRVSSASATGSFAGTPVGSCAARAVRRAKFPSSQQTLTVKYPFKL